MVMVSKQFEGVLRLVKERVTREPQTIKEMRAEFETNAKMFKVAEDIHCEPLRIGNILAEWIIPPRVVEGCVILYLHGGGYVMGSIDTHREMVSRISRAPKSRTLLIEYRLAPENPFPAALEDAGAAYRWLLAGGWNPKRMAIAGDSAGGGLAVAALVNARDVGDPLPAASVCLSPWVDLEGIGESMTTKAEIDPIVQREGILVMARTYLGHEDPRTPLAAPLYADLRRLPPMLIQVGSSEILFDDARRLATQAEKTGVEVTLETWKDMFHIWHYFASLLPEGRKAIDRIGGFIREHTA
jgi:acetyl esterase/lipase